MINRYTTLYKFLNLTIDFLLLNVSMFITYALSNKLVLFSSSRKHLMIVLVFNLMWLLSTNLCGFYEDVLNKDSVKTYRSLIKTYLVFISLLSAVIIFIGPESYYIARRYLFLSLIMFGFLLGLWKLIFLSVRLSERTALMSTRAVVILGGGRIGHDLYQLFVKNPDFGYRAVGIFDDDIDRVVDRSLYLGPSDSCISYVLANHIREIFCALPLSESARIEQLMYEADKSLIRFKSVPEYFDYSKRATIVQSLGHIPIISFRAEPLENLFNSILKRCFDWIFSLFVIVFICSWLFPIIAILIKLESSGPVFFMQPRSGRDSTPFRCYKFRSMNTKPVDHFVQATKNDSRVTKIGKILRKTSLDELPQFFNVLKGDMSVVGPRPHPLKLDKEYMDLINTYMVRHLIKPGITGWAQVIGLRGETPNTESMHNRVKADVWYLENWSFLLDLKIIFLTFYNVFKGDKNAY